MRRLLYKTLNVCVCVCLCVCVCVLFFFCFPRSQKSSLKRVAQENSKAPIPLHPSESLFQYTLPKAWWKITECSNKKSKRHHIFNSWRKALLPLPPSWGSPKECYTLLLVGLRTMFWCETKIAINQHQWTFGGNLWNLCPACPRTEHTMSTEVRLVSWFHAGVHWYRFAGWCGGTRTGPPWSSVVCRHCIDVFCWWSGGRRDGTKNNAPRAIGISLHVAKTWQVRGAAA